MDFLGDIPSAPGFDFNLRLPTPKYEAEYRGDREPSEEAFLTFELEQLYVQLEGGKQNLRLLKPLKLKLDSETMKVQVQDWRVQIDYANLGQLPREIARQFMKLMSKAEGETLSASEQADWLRIVDHVDFQQFCVDRSAPRYMEGKLTNRGSTVVVEWHDGTRETLDRNASRALSEVDAGERFAAFVKVGTKNRTLAMERVSLVPADEKN